MAASWGRELKPAVGTVSSQNKWAAVGRRVRSVFVRRRVLIVKGKN